MFMLSFSQHSPFHRSIGLVLGIALLALVALPVSAQDGDQANEFITALSALNAKAIEENTQATGSTSQVFTTEMDALRAKSYTAEIEARAGMAIQDANLYVTQLDNLRTLEGMPMVAISSE